MRFSLPKKLRRLMGLPEDKYSEAELAELRNAVPLGQSKMVGYKRDTVRFLHLDQRANVHIVELDRCWMATVGVERACGLMADAVENAGAQLAKARRN